VGQQARFDELRISLARHRAGRLAIAPSGLLRGSVPLGRILLAAIKGSWNRGGGALINQAIHGLDIIALGSRDR